MPRLWPQTIQRHISAAKIAAQLGCVTVICVRCSNDMPGVATYIVCTTYGQTHTLIKRKRRRSPYKHAFSDVAVPCVRGPDEMRLWFRDNVAERTQMAT